MRVKTSHLRAALLVSALFSTLAFSQGKSVITGTVTDAASGKPVPDVVVTVTSPALQGEETVVTDEAGIYRVPQLPAGTYLIRLEKESYKPFSRADVSVRLERTIRVNLQLVPESLQSETIVVVGKAPVVDVGSTASGINVGKEFINNIAFLQPNANGVRSFEALAAVAPQVSGDSFGYGFSGAQSPENLYLVDGVSTSDPAFGINGSAFPVDFLDDANVITGGYQAEYGRATGGVISVETKSGGNEFKGSVWGNWTPGILSGTEKDIPSDSSIFVTKNQLWNTFDFGAEIGGPIIKDKLWFYAGIAPSFARTQTSRRMRAFVLDGPGGERVVENGLSTTEDLPGTLTTRFDDQRSISYIAKLTYALNANHKLSLSAVGSPSFERVPYLLTPTQVPGWNGGTDRIHNNSTVSLRYQGSFFDKALLSDVSLGWFHVDSNSSDGFPGLPNDGSTVGGPRGVGATGTPAINLISDHNINEVETLNAEAAAICAQANRSCPVSGAGATYSFGGPGFLSEQSVDRYQVRGSLTYLMRLAGSHQWKAGLDIEHLRYDIKKAYSGGVYLQENANGLRFDDFRQYGTVTGGDTGERQLFIRSIPTSWGVGAFVQDSWSIMDVVTLNAGLRYDTQQLFNSVGDLGLTLNNMLSPRIGLIYDFTQQGRSKIFANYARFYESVPIDIADRSLTGENEFRFRRFKAPTNGGPGCDPLKDINQALVQCEDPRNFQNIRFGNDYQVVNTVTNSGSGKVPVDPDLQPQSSDEFSAGAEYEIISNGRLGATYTKRWLNNVIEDMSLDEGSTYFISNPGYGLAAQFPKAVRDYDAVTLYFTKTFSDGWQGQASYTWSSLRGNYNGLFRPETDQINPNANSDFDLVSLLGNRTGQLSGDRTHFIKAYGAKEFKITSELGILVGLTYEGRSGTPINYYGAHPIYGTDEAFVLPRGSGGNLPWRHVVNGKLALSYQLSKENAISISADVFNMFNFQAVTSVDESLTTTNILPFVAPAGVAPAAAACLTGEGTTDCPVNGPLPIQTDDPAVPLTRADLNANYKQPKTYQAPISVRFGIKFTF